MRKCVNGDANLHVSTAVLPDCRNFFLGREVCRRENQIAADLLHFVSISLVEPILTLFACDARKKRVCSIKFVFRQLNAFIQEWPSSELGGKSSG